MKPALHYHGARWSVSVPSTLRILPQENQFRKPHAYRVRSPNAYRVRSPNAVYKHCANCNTWKRLDQFGHNAIRWDHKDYYCKECRNDNQHRT